jgi:hypothetical protein
LVVVDGLAEPIDDAVEVLFGVVGLGGPPLLEEVLELEEDAAGHEGVRASLMHCADALHIKGLRYLTQTTTTCQLLNVSLDFLDVVVVVEVIVHHVEEDHLSLRQVSPQESPQHVPKINSPMEGHPVVVWI